MEKVVLDIETTGRPANNGGRLLYVGWDACGSPRPLKELLADPEVAVITMTKYDVRYLRQLGWDICGPYYDLQVMAWILNENQPLDLDSLARRYCNIQMDKRIERSANQPYFRRDDGTRVPLDELEEDDAELSDYCERDVAAEKELFDALWRRLEDTDWLDYFLEEQVPFTETLVEMELAGLPVNVADSARLEEELEEQAEDMEASLKAEANLPESFNLNSSDHLASYIYYPAFELRDALPITPEQRGDLKRGEHDSMPAGFTVGKVGRAYAHGLWTLPGLGIMPTEKTPSGDKWSTSSPVLRANFDAASHPWVQSLLAYRKVQKMLTTYLRPMPDRAVAGRLYGTYNQTGTKTGRLSSAGPNMQNMPSHGPLGEAMRGLFQGDLVVGDYSQLEPRLMAHFSQDPFLLRVYREGLDIYREVAAAVFGTTPDEVSDTERGIAKTLVLAMGYGAGDKKVGNILTINGYPTAQDEAAAYLKEMRRLLATLFDWREAVIVAVKGRGYVETIGGHHRRLRASFEDRRNWKNIGYGERQAVNAIIQGSAADILRHVMVECRRVKRLTLLAQVHDELVFENTGNADEGNLLVLKHIAEQEHGFKLDVPLVFEPHFGDSWLTAKEGTVVGLDDEEED
jgi:DNA polymerase I-like protein with 3'-5' exonuclease and polymerase domains